MNYRDFDLFPEEIPSPEELFQIDIGEAPTPEKQEEAEPEEPEAQTVPEVQAVPEVPTVPEVQAAVPEVPAEKATGKKKPAKSRRAIRFFSAGFVILILVIALFITNMDKFHLHCYCMMTDSMGKTIPKGSVVFSYEIPMDELEVGDVITYINSQGISVTHQIVSEIYDYNESGSRAFYTKGTENDTVDEDAVTYDMIKGKVVIYIPYIARPFIH